MQRVIGLDIGSYSIKAVEIVNTFKSYEIASFYENVISHADELDPDLVIPKCMEQLFSENQLKADRIITAMPGQYISSRVMRFGFSDPRKVEAGILAGLEDAVPFNMDDMIIDHQILGTHQSQTIALAVMTRKTFLKSFLDHLQRIQIDPKLVDVDSLAFYNLASHMEIPAGQTVALVDVGHEKTSLCIVQNGVLKMFRSINLGGRYLTEFLARDLETDFAEAQRVKHSISRVICDQDPGSDLSGDEKMIVERLTLAANGIVKELGRTFYAFKTWEKAPIEKIWLSGGTSRIRNFDQYLKDQLEIPVEMNRLDDTGLKLHPDLTPYMEIMTQSVAIGLRAVTTTKKHSQINLRQGEFAYVQNYESILKGLRVAVKVISVAALLLGLSFGVKYYFYQSQIDALQQQFQKEYVALLPGTKIPAKTPFTKVKSDAILRLKREVSQKKNALDSFNAENGASPSLLILKELSEKIPKEQKVEVTLYQYNATVSGGGKLILRGETDSYASAESVLESIKAATTIKNVESKQSGPKPGTDNKIIEFTIHADSVTGKEGSS